MHPDQDFLGSDEYDSSTHRVTNRCSFACVRYDDSWRTVQSGRFQDWYPFGRPPPAEQRGALQ